jgi:hypothetical protein
VVNVSRIVRLMSGLSISPPSGHVPADPRPSQPKRARSPLRWWREEAGNPWFSLAGAVLGAIATWFGILASTNGEASASSLWWAFGSGAVIGWMLGIRVFGNFRRTILGAVIGLIITLVAGGDRRDALVVTVIGGLLGMEILEVVWIILTDSFRAATTTANRLSPHAVPIGTALIIAGVGLIVAKLPETLGYAFKGSENPFVFVDAALNRGEIILACGAMMVVGGWFIRQSASRR